MKIHGGTKSNPKPALDGLYSTVQKKCKTSVLGDNVLTDRKTVNYVVKKSKERELASFEGSKDNILRSIATYYSAGVMGKRKYQAVRTATTMKASNIKRGVKRP